MGNLAIALMTQTINLSDNYAVKRQKRIEHERIRSLIPRYLARLNNRDISIITLNLNGLGVDCRILRLLSGPLLSGETRVQELYLQNNRIGPEGATCIARILSRDTHLKDVSLAHNPVGYVGTMAIASALEQNSSLEKLDLSHCGIDDAGTERLAHSLRSNSHLKYIYLEGNYISNIGIYSLLKCVYDTSRGMHSLWESNHTLRAFYGQRSIYSPSMPETAANRQLVRQLAEIMATCNRRYSTPPSSCFSSSHQNASNKIMSDTAYKMSARIAACKILRHYIRREKMMEYLECVESMEEKLVPYVIGWLVRYGDAGVIYSVVRDMPWLLEKKAGEKKGVPMDGGNIQLIDEEESSVNEGRMENVVPQPQRMRLSLR